MFNTVMQQISEHYERQLPFVVYRKPNESQVSVVFQKDAGVYHPEDFTETGFVFAPFNASEKSILLRVDEFVTTTFDGKSDLPKIKPLVQVANHQKEFHIQLVKKGISNIDAGDFQKVILSRRIEIDCDKRPFELFERLLTLYKNAFCYLWYHPRIGTWLGATPEILLRVNNGQLTTMSLAGTQKYVDGTAVNWGQKELEEQELVTDYILRAMEGKVTQLNISSLETIKAGNLLHLRTKISGFIEKKNLPDIIGALHPTPAVCGMPMEKAKAFILENENYTREYYTGYLGELNFKTETQRTGQRKNHENLAYRTVKSTTTLFVNLRCMQVKENRALVYVGGGITKDSDPEKEWQETIAKTNTMFQVLIDT